MFFSRTANTFFINWGNRLICLSTQSEAHPSNHLLTICIWNNINHTFKWRRWFPSTTFTTITYLFNFNKFSEQYWLRIAGFNKISQSLILIFLNHPRTRHSHMGTYSHQNHGNSPNPTNSLLNCNCNSSLTKYLWNNCNPNIIKYFVTSLQFLFQHATAMINRISHLCCILFCKRCLCKLWIFSM